MGCDSYPWGFELVGVCPIQPHTEDWKFKYAATEMNLVASDVRVWRGAGMIARAHIHVHVRGPNRRLSSALALTAQ